jgi:hypothetical protein
VTLVTALRPYRRTMMTAVDTKTKNLIDNLKNCSFTEIRPTDSIGQSKQLGVFAIRDIPANIDPFQTCNQDHNVVWFTDTDLNQFTKQTQDRIKKFISPNSEGQYPIPETGLNSMDTSFYCNYKFGDLVNLKVLEKDDGRGLNAMATTRLVKKGEELFLPEYHVPESENCIGCSDHPLTAEEQGNITGCSCKASLMCTVCAVNFYKPRLQDIIRRVGGVITITGRTAKCPTCSDVVSDTFIEKVISSVDTNVSCGPIARATGAIERVSPSAPAPPKPPKGSSYKCAKLDNETSNTSDGARPPGGQDGVAWMDEDKNFVSVSIYPDTYVNADARMKRQENEAGRPDGPRRTRGVTTYKFYAAGKNGREEVMTDEFSETDETIQYLVDA